MKLTEWFLNFDFGGRARRSHYWANLGAWFGVGIALLIVIAIVAPKDGATTPASAGAGVFVGLLLLAAGGVGAVDGMAMIFRRAHDTGRSGWIWLLLLIPLVGLLAFYWLMIEDSQQGPNKYGPPVKQFYQPEAAA